MSDPYADPRPDLSLDSKLWPPLLRAARDHSGPNGEPYGTLYHMRCLGARLTLVDGKLRLGAGRGGEYDASEYARDRAKYLLPMQHILTLVLAEAAPKGSLT